MRTFLIALVAFTLAACAPASEAPLAPVCDQVQFVDHVIVDVPVQQGTTVMPGTIFTKTWQVRNSGACDWGEGYALVHTGGRPMNPEEEIAIPAVASGETVDLSIRMRAPGTPGGYASEWMLRNPEGVLFGFGAEGDKPFTVELIVADLPAGVIYDFTQMVCLARWDSARAQFLPCDGEDDEHGDLDGYVRVNIDPALEGQTRGNPPVIEMKPNNQRENWISGFFPPITVAAGDHFLATVGCMDGNGGCSVTFKLEAQTPDGVITTLGEWHHVFDETPAKVEVDLSPLTEQEVTLILTLKDNGGRRPEARGFWLDPRIENSNR